MGRTGEPNEPDPDASPTPAAPGSEGVRENHEHGHGQFQEAYDAASDEVAASGSIAHDDDEAADDESRDAEGR